MSEFEIPIFVEEVKGKKLLTLTTSRYEEGQRLTNARVIVTIVKNLGEGKYEVDSTDGIFTGDQMY